MGGIGELLVLQVHCTMFLSMCSTVPVCIKYVLMSKPAVNILIPS